MPSQQGQDAPQQQGVGHGGGNETIGSTIQRPFLRMGLIGPSKDQKGPSVRTCRVLQTNPVPESDPLHNL